MKHVLCHLGQCYFHSESERRAEQLEEKGKALRGAQIAGESIDCSLDYLS